METRIETHRHYTDQERYEHCRKCRLSGLTVSEYARRNGLSRSTLKDWIGAYNNIHGKFINVSTVSENENEIVNNSDFRVNILGKIEKMKKCNHFSRFDHSIVVIEYKDVKLTTSLEQAEILLDRIL